MLINPLTLRTLSLPVEHQCINAGQEKCRLNSRVIPVASQTSHQIFSTAAYIQPAAVLFFLLQGYLLFCCPLVRHALVFWIATDKTMWGLKVWWPSYGSPDCFAGNKKRLSIMMKTTLSRLLTELFVLTNTKPVLFMRAKCCSWQSFWGR